MLLLKLSHCLRLLELRPIFVQLLLALLNHVTHLHVYFRMHGAQPVSLLLGVWGFEIVFCPIFVVLVLEVVGKIFGMHVVKATNENLLAYFAWK